MRLPAVNMDSFSTEDQVSHRGAAVKIKNIRHCLQADNMKLLLEN
jgi:hypothetical protein